MSIVRLNSKILTSMPKIEKNPGIHPKYAHFVHFGSKMIENNHFRARSKMVISRIIILIKLKYLLLNDYIKVQLFMSNPRRNVTRLDS